MKLQRIGILLAVGIFGACHILIAETPPHGCTVLTFSHGGEVFFGGNDDYNSRDKAYWVDPGVDAGYGAIYFGDPQDVQQGFNEVGLAYDANGLPESPVLYHQGILPGPKEHGSYPIAILKACANVDEVIEWVKTHRWHSSMQDQLHFADASGNAVVISVGADGRLAFSRKPAGDSFLVSTNFNVANPQNGSFPSWRYDLATKRATELIGSKDVSREQIASIMEAAHVETRRNFTVYTVVADLVRKQVAVYFLFQYDDPIVLDIRSELAKGSMLTTLRKLFPDSTVARGDAALDRLHSVSRGSDIIGIVWAATVLLCVSLWFIMPAIRAGGISRLFVIAALGPLGFLIGLIASRTSEGEARKPVDGARPQKWRAAVSSAGLDTASVVVPLVVCVLVATMVPAVGSSSAIFLVLLVVVPIGFAWLFVRSPGLSLSARVGYVRAAAASVAPSFFASSILIAAMLPFLLPGAIWLAVRTNSVLTLVCAVWAFSIVVCVAGLCVLAVVHGVSSIAQRAINRRRIATKALMISAGLLLLIAGIYLSSQTLVWSKPFIDGAGLLR